MSPYECIETAKALLTRICKYEPYRTVSVHGRPAYLIDVLQNDTLREALIRSTAGRIASGNDAAIMDELRAYRVCSYS